MQICNNIFIVSPRSNSTHILPSFGAPHNPLTRKQPRHDPILLQKHPRSNKQTQTFLICLSDRKENGANPNIGPGEEPTFGLAPFMNKVYLVICQFFLQFPIIAQKGEGIFWGGNLGLTIFGGGWSII